jgi:hypothetical protein
MTYRLEGDLLEVCNCNVLCPCWVGEDPDNGICESTLAYVIDEGTIDGVDVGGLVVAGTAFIPGNVFAGNWNRRIYVDERASPEQEQALVDLLQGRKGGPFADLAALVGQDVGIQRARIDYTIEKGKGRFAIEGVLEAVMAPFQGATGKPTTLAESAFSTIPGSPAYVGKAERFWMKEPSLGIDIDIEGRNAIQGRFAFDHQGEAAAA